jgi:hypothetical protein
MAGESMRMSNDASELRLHQVDLVEPVTPEGAAIVEHGLRSDLDARQDEALRMLDELNARIEAVILSAVGPTPVTPAHPAAA